MASKKKYSFAEKNYSEGGRASTIIACASLGLFVIDAVISFAANGKAGRIVGLLAIGAALLSVYGFYVGMKSFAEKGVSLRLSIIGSISCGVVMIGWLTILLRGI
ncbi:MAG: hypothetical protein Q4A32_05025 [Lachnospiraceae bacterium]|nr:hypothetical protein [Lachnospiraceae bacterium]